MSNFFRTLDPKLWKPVVVAILAIVAQWIVTGEFGKIELAQTLLTIGYAAIGYQAPNDGTILRTLQESGNAVPPEHEESFTSLSE